MHEKTKRIVVCAMLIAMGVLLSGLSIPSFTLGVYTVKTGIGIVPVLLAGILFGPTYGGLVGLVVDILQAFLFPKGAFVPWFSIVGALFGVIPGLFFMKRQKPTLPRVAAAVVTTQLFCSVICNTLLIMWLYGQTAAVLLPVRLVNQAVMIPIYTVLLMGVLYILGKIGYTPWSKKE